MARSGKRSAKRPSEARGETPALTEASEAKPPNTTPPEPSHKPPLLVRLRAHALLLFSATLMFLGFAGFGVWWVGFFAMLPALFVVDPMEDRGGFDRPVGRRFFFRAWLFGTFAYMGGFYWIAYTLQEFSGFPLPVASLFATIFWGFQGLQFTLMLWLFRRTRAHGWSATAALPAAYVACEAVFPMLFEHYYGNGLYRATILTQIADLGGPETCTALVMIVNGALYDVLSARSKRQPMPRLGPGLAVAAVLFTLGYGAYRMAQVESFLASGPSLRVALVQPNLGLFERFEDPSVGDRTRAMTVALEAEDPAIELFVWPESAVTYWLDGVQSVHRTVLRDVHRPVVFGGLRHAERDGHEVDHNPAFLADANGRLIDSYDKTYLLAFGEYLPFGDEFPVLYDISPMSGRFSSGDHVEPLELPDVHGETLRLTALICYEDIVSRFVRRAVAEGDPDFLVNVTVDTWFGDTQEPWVHLTLATFRAIEHRRFLVRSTNSGVSAFIDPLGRVTSHTATFEQATLVDDVRLGAVHETLYELLGPWPGYVSLLGVAFMLSRRRTKPTARALA